MEPLSLNKLADDLLTRAREESSGRGAHNLLVGRQHPLSQTVIVLTAGHELAEHDSPGEATLYVLGGRVRFSAGADSCELSTGDFLPIPRERHSVAAAEDSVLILTVVKDSRPAQ